MHSCRSSVPRTVSRNLTLNNNNVIIKPVTNQVRTMAFFPRTFYHPQAASFTPLVQFLNDFDQLSRQGGYNCHPASRRTNGLTRWQPKFDVRETNDAYELHGELPGIAKENVSIEFTEPQTLVVRGKVVRSYNAGTQPDAATTATTAEVEEKPTTEAVTPGSESPKSTPSHQATVEDDIDIDSQEHEDGFEEVVKKTDKDAASTTTTNTTSAPVEKKAQDTKPADKAKYWLSERSVGEFSRTFSFPSRVEQEGVSASFDNGVLSISVPKAKKHEARRIAIN